MGNNYCETFWNEFLRNDRNEYENIYLKLIHKNILMLNHITPYTNTVNNSLRYLLEQIYYNGNWQFIQNVCEQSVPFQTSLVGFRVSLDSSLSLKHFPLNLSMGNWLASQRHSI